jgi:hypothetical protein
MDGSAKGHAMNNYAAAERSIAEHCPAHASGAEAGRAMRPATLMDPNEIKGKIRFMKRPANWLLLATGVGVGLFLSGASGSLFESLVSQGHAQQNTTPKLGEDGAHAPSADQSHVMADVGYHFANLWFAADKQNWLLANYYLAETRSHLRWAVKLHPVRQTKAGDVDLNGILDAVDNSLLSEVGKAIENKDAASFRNAYRQTLVGCYACHKACEKPFLRPQVPSAASVSILNFDPAATWPE